MTLTHRQLKAYGELQNFKNMNPHHLESWWVKLTILLRIVFDPL